MPDSYPCEGVSVRNVIDAAEQQEKGQNWKQKSAKTR